MNGSVIKRYNEMKRQFSRMREMKSGQIMATAALAGLAVIVAVYIFLKLNPPAERGPQPHYDQVFKYCTTIFTVDEQELAALRRDERYKVAAALRPGEYAFGDKGFLYILGSGMFEILLPSQLQVVRNFGDVKVTSASDRPSSVMGCTPEHLAQALRAYDIILPDNSPKDLPQAR